MLKTFLAAVSLDGSRFRQKAAPAITFSFRLHMGGLSSVPGLCIIQV